MSSNNNGFKITLPGYNARDATPEQCAIHSSFPPLKSKTEQSPPHFATLDVDFTATITQNLAQQLCKIPHNYGYIPFSIANIIFSDGSGIDVTGIGNAFVGATFLVSAYCDADYFIIEIYDDFNWTSANARLQVSYYIFAENGT